MISEKEEEFIDYWSKNRVKEKVWFRQLFPALPLSICMAAAIIWMLNSGWYIRATAEFNTQTSPVVIIVCLVLIIVFISVFYKRYRWEMNEQTYRELLIKKQKDTASKASKTE